MKKLIPISSLDQLNTGDIITQGGEYGLEFKILAKVGLLVFLSEHGRYCFDRSGDISYTVEHLIEDNFKLEVEEGKWKPLFGERYYYPITDYGYADYDSSTLIGECDPGSKRIENNMVFKTKEEAITAAQKMLDVLKDNQ